jgi:hypothetical protein
MTTFRPWIAAVFVGMASATGAAAYWGTWHVVEDLGSKTCYRVHEMAPRNGWKDFGELNTFRMAGAWIWNHRDTCRSSPVFEGFGSAE